MLYYPSNNLDPAILTELQKIAQVLVLIETGNIFVRATAPLKPRDGDTSICDGTNWDPIGDGVKRPVWYDSVTTTWKKFDV